MATTKTKTVNYHEANARRASRQIEPVHARLAEIDRLLDANGDQDWAALLDERRKLRADRERLDLIIRTHSIYTPGIRA